MIAYTVVSATYADDDHTSAIAITLEAGAVAISAIDRPELWAQLPFVTVESFEKPGITVQQVATERQRRLALGFNYDFGGARGIHRIGTTPEDMKGWDDVTALSQANIALGLPSAQIGIVTQHTFLFNDTVRNNIAYGDPSRSIEAVELTSKAAHAHEFVMAMPRGYDSMIGDFVDDEGP